MNQRRAAQLASYHPSLQSLEFDSTYGFSIGHVVTAKPDLQVVDLFRAYCGALLSADDKSLEALTLSGKNERFTQTVYALFVSNLRNAHLINGDLFSVSDSLNFLHSAPYIEYFIGEFEKLRDETLVYWTAQAQPQPPQQHQDQNVKSE